MNQFRGSLGFNATQLNSPLSTQIKLTKTLGGVVFVYILAYVPSSIVGAFIIGKPSNFLHIVWYVTVLLWCPNFWANPCIYAAKNKDFKVAFKKILGMGRKSNQVHNNDMKQMK